MLHQQIGINNPDLKDFNKVTGYLTVSIDIQGPGDKAVQLELGSDAEVALSEPLMPSSIKKSYKQLHFKLFRAENLPVMDLAMIGEGSTDAYVQMSYGGKSLKSKYVETKKNKVEWNQEMLIPIELPIKEEKVKFRVYDHDSAIDDLVCSFELSVREILMQEEKKIRWIDLYGPKEPGNSGQYT